MPNWASVTYECVGDLKDIRLLHDALKYIDKRKTTIVPNGFGKWWLGNLVTKLGGNWEQYPCRGDITSYSLENETTLMIWQGGWHRRAKAPLVPNHREIECFFKRGRN